MVEGVITTSETETAMATAVEQTAAPAPDRAKEKALCDALLAFPIPDFTSVPGKAIHAHVDEALGAVVEEIDEMATHL